MALNAIYPMLKQRGIELTAVAVQDSPDTTAAIRRSLNLQFPTANDVDATLSENYNIGMVPVLTVVDRAGVLQPVEDPKTGEPTLHIRGYRDWTSPEGMRALFKLAEESKEDSSK